MFDHQGVEELLPDLGELETGAEELVASQQQQQVRRLLPHATLPFHRTYDLGPLLGSGSFAQVWACAHKATRAELACKTVGKASLSSGEKWDNLQREVVVLSAISGKHRGVITLVEVLEDDRSLHLITELCRGGDLYELISSRGRLPEAAARAVLRQVASALSFCHSLGILHRDIKPENILFDAHAHDLHNMASAHCAAPPVHAKLADFGLSLALRPGEKARGSVGSRWYTAPELVLGKKYGRRVDVWSLGVVLCTMLSGKLPFAGKTHSDDEGLRKAILRGRVNFKQPAYEGVSEAAKEVISLMLQVDPTKRITSFDLLMHPWVRGADAGP